MHCVKSVLSLVSPDQPVARIWSLGGVIGGWCHTFTPTPPGYSTPDSVVAAQQEAAGEEGCWWSQPAALPPPWPEASTGITHGNDFPPARLLMTSWPAVQSQQSRRWQGRRAAVAQHFQLHLQLLELGMGALEGQGKIRRDAGHFWGGAPPWNIPPWLWAWPRWYKFSGYAWFLEQLGKCIMKNQKHSVQVLIDSFMNTFPYWFLQCPKWGT